MELFKPEILEEYENFISSHPKGHFMQSFYWSKVKTEWKWNAVIERDEKGNIIGTLSFLIRKIPYLPYSLMYAPRGPVCFVENEELVKTLIDAAKEEAKKNKCYLIKIDPDIKNTDKNFRDLMIRQGFKIKDENKNFEGIQPRFVFRLDIKGKTPDELLASFHQKTRYNIRVAIKNGVQVKHFGKAILKDFIPIMRTTGERDNFTTRPLEYFEKMADALGDKMRVYIASFEGTPIAGAICIHYGSKVWYLYGASANIHRNTMPNYLIQFEMIKWAVEEGCSVYDFRGVSGDMDENNPLYGIYRFKKGFNPELTEFIGELDFVCNKPIYFLTEKGLKTFKGLKKFIFNLKDRQKNKDGVKNETSDSGN